MRFEKLLYRETLDRIETAGFHDLLKYKDKDLEIWISFSELENICNPCIYDIFIRKNGEDFKPTEPKSLIEEDGKIKIVT